MKIMCVDVNMPRSDGKSGKPTGITIGKVYVVAEILTTTGQYSIINDDLKMARYNMNRFTIHETGELKSIRDSFNTLTTPMRSRIKELEKQIQEILK